MKLIAVAVSLVLAASAAPATAQTSAPQNAFARFKKAMEGNKVVWPHYEDKRKDRITTHTVRGSGCFPDWTQRRANRDGSDAVAESTGPIDFAKVTGIEAEEWDPEWDEEDEGNSLEFELPGEGTVGIQTSTRAVAQEIVASMKALQAACART